MKEKKIMKKKWPRDRPFFLHARVFFGRARYHDDDAAFSLFLSLSLSLLLSPRVPVDRAVWRC